MMTNKIWYFLFAALILTTSCGSDDDEVFIGNWTIRSDFDGAARYGASSFVIGDKAYITCGIKGDSKKTYLKDLYVYDVASDSWKGLASMDETVYARAYAVAFTAAEGSIEKGYVTTGFTDVIVDEKEILYLRDTWAYDPSSNTWAQKADLGVGPDMPEGAPARQHAIGIGFKGKGYVGTGGNEDGRLKDFYEYNANEDKWYSKAHVGGSKREGALAWVVNNAIYVGLGTGNSQYFTDLRAFTPPTDGSEGVWVEKAKLFNASTDEDFDDKYNMQRAHGVAFVLNNLAYIALGESGSLRNDTWEYEPVSDRWVQKTSFEGSARRNAVAFTVKNRSFIATGNSGGRVFEDSWEFKPFEEVNDNDNQN